MLLDVYTCTDVTFFLRLFVLFFFVFVGVCVCVCVARTRMVVRVWGLRRGSTARAHVWTSDNFTEDACVCVRACVRVDAPQVPLAPKRAKDLSVILDAAGV